MNTGCVFLFVFNPFLAVFQNKTGVETATLIWIIIVLLVLLIAILGWEFQKTVKKRNSGGYFRFFRKVKLEVVLDKDRPFRPQVLILTIRNIGKNEADIQAPVLEFRKIWTKRKFKLNGISGRQTYPMYVDSGDSHQLRIKTSAFHQYDKDLKSFYWARIYVSDVNGRKWKSNDIKLRKSLVT